MKRGQEELAEEAKAEKQPKLDEVDQNQEETDEGEEVPNEEFLKPELACEIYAALPAFYQRKLLILCRDIYELGSSPDEWVRWKILRWIGNCWNPNDTNHKVLQLSPNGLNMAIRAGYHGFIRALLAAEFPPTRLEGPQICYFELKHIRGFFRFGFCGRELNGQYSSNVFCLSSGGLYTAETFFNYLPNVHIRLFEIATLGCGLMKHLGKRKIFFTKNGQLLAKPIALPSTAPNELFPLIIPTYDCSFVDTNFGLRPFLFKYAGNEEKLSEEMIWE